MIATVRLGAIRAEPLSPCGGRRTFTLTEVLACSIESL